MKRYLFVVVVLVLAACGGGETADTDSGSSATPTTAAPAAQSDATEAPADEPNTTDASSDEPATQSGPGGITLTIGDETWEFEGALCAYYNAEPGQPGSEWNVSFTDDGGQVYADVTGEYPSLSYGGWSAEGDAVVFAYDGDTITAEATFQNDAGGPADEGAFTATCASWFAG